MPRLRLILCVFLLATGLAATEILREDTAPGLGLATIPLAGQTWRSQVMTWPGKVGDQDRVWTGPDFFTQEYGEPCVFTRDWITEQGYSRDGAYTVADGALGFTTGAKGFLFGFGGLPGDLSRPSVRLGAAWGPCKKDLFRLQLDLDQDVAETAWEFTVNYFKRRNDEPVRFTVRGQGRQTGTFEAGLVRTVGAATGFSLRCVTPGASVRLRSLRLAPSSADVCFRRTLSLANKPVLAHLSLLAYSLESYDLYVNGKVIDSGRRIYPSGRLRHVDLTPHLVAGENLIALRREFLSWSGGTPEVLLEGVAVDGDGNLTRLLGDAGWKCALNAGAGWTAAGFDDSAWLAPRLAAYSTALADNTPVATGLEPRHMGLLDAAPAGRQYPVFGPGEVPAFRVRLPPGVRGRLQPHLDIFQAGGGPLVEGGVALSEGKVVDGMLEYQLRPSLRTVGPYRLQWTLRDGAGAVVETRQEELILTGPIAQTTLPLAGFEAELDQRLELVRHIDCSQEPGDDREFLDHSGMYNPAKTGKGQVVKAEGLAWRETGKGSYDYFAYRLHLPASARGEPHLVEVLVPDNRDRYVYSCVIETFPLPFPNNPWPLGSRGWITASGTGLTGGTWYPLSNGTKSLRYIYHPGSQNAAVVVMSGFADAPAAACAINIYRIAGGLPALAVPASGRRFGSHHERVSVTALSTASENPLELDPGIRRSGHRDAWSNWYRAIERKIRLLRFQGQNMTVEGVYMYNEGDVPSLRHNNYTSNQDFDLPHLMLRMYGSNGIQCLLGFEYCNSPEMEARGEATVSDRRMWQGTPGAHAVDRHGRQLVGSFSGDGINFLDPAMEQRLLDTLGEIRDRYRGLGPATGLFLVTGDWWAPGFVHGDYRDLDSTEVGYDDLTCGLFERETGISLGTRTDDPQRFQKRYDQLMGAHQALWLHWRGLKLRAAIDKLRARITAGTEPWPLFLYPSTGSWPQSPFIDAASTRDARDGCLATYLASQGLPLEMYADQPGLHLVTPLHEVDFFANHRPGDAVLPWHGWNTNPGTRAVMQRLDTLYMSTQLNEVDLPAGAAKRWLWSHTARGVFVLRGAGDNAMHHFLTAMRDSTPKTTFYSWIDGQLETGFGEQQRRFATAYYATPEVGFTPLPAGRAQGIVAQVAPRPGGAWLRLVNTSPYPLTGSVWGGACRDRVYDRTVAVAEDGECHLDLPPNDLRILEVDAEPGLVACRFAFPAAISATLRTRASYILDQPRLLRSIPGDLIARLFAGLRSQDDFELYDTLDDYEVAARLHRADAELQALDRQRTLLADLAAHGSARIDCAGMAESIDAKGRRWLPDQTWLDCGAYGNQDANFADRGSLPIAGTAAERVCQTEAYGDHVFYRIPVPKGVYNVHLHFAETYGPIQRPGVRLFSVRIKDHLWERKIDPYAEAGGFAKAVVRSEKALAVYDGLIVIELIGGVGIQGIEIETVK